MTHKPTGLVDIGDPFKDLVWHALVKFALQNILKAIPILALPGLSLITGTLLGIVANFLYDALKMFMSMEAISIKNDKLRHEFASASVKLKIIARDKGIDSPEFKEARLANQKALTALVCMSCPR